MPEEHPPVLESILESDVDPKYTLTQHLWRYLQGYKKKHRDAGHGFGYSSFGPDDVTRTLSARYYKDGSEILSGKKGGRPRRLTPRECSRLMGFDKPWSNVFRIPVSDTQAYRQFGNCCCCSCCSGCCSPYETLYCRLHGIEQAKHASCI